jgi:DNA-binding PadR family transcriptional regulator
MYRDNSLIPSEAVRLLALGILASGDKRYGALASEVRYFTSHVVGPSLDLVAPPLELLKVEGLIEAAGDDDLGDEAVLRVTEAGRADLAKLLTANVRAPVNDINKLILTLKMRFLHLLEPAQQKLQLEVLIEMSERELARLTELRAHHAEDAGFLTEWLDHGTAETAARLEWLRNLLDRLG